MNAPSPQPPATHHLLRRGLRPARAARRLRRREHHRRSGASRQFRPHLLEGLGAGRDAGARRAPPSSPAAAERRQPRARSLAARARPVADGFKRIIEREGPDAVAFYLRTTAHRGLLRRQQTDEGFIGSANVDTNSRLCMASSVAGHRRAFGADTVPGTYEDLDAADLIVLVGSNAAWCHPVLFQRMVKNRGERGARIVVIDPRRTATAEDADLHLPIASGMDSALLRAARPPRRPLRARLSLYRRPYRRVREHARARARSHPISRRRPGRPACHGRRGALLRSLPHDTQRGDLLARRG